MKKDVNFGFGNIPGYWIKRRFRLYPLLILSATVAALLELYYFGQTGIAGASDWANSQHRIPDGEVAYEWFVNAVGHSSHINTPAWSISVELLGSLIFPLIYLMTRRGYVTIIAITVSLTAMFFFPVESKKIYFMDLYTFSFVLGALIPRYGPWLVARFNTLGSGAKSVILAVTMLTFLFARALIAPDDSKSPMVVLVESVSAALIITLIQHHPSASFLKNPIAQEMGRISYGVYLFHLLVLFVIAQVLLPALAPVGVIAQLVAFMALLIASLAITLLLSRLIHVVFESKLQELGRRISNTLDRFVASKRIARISSERVQENT